MIRCLLLALATLAYADSVPRYDGYVNDFAGKLSPSDRDALESRLRDYERDTSNEVAVAIVESLDGQSVDEYARRLFQSWGIGKRDKNNGVLLLWAPVERKVRIQVGYGLEGSLSDRAAAEILRAVTDRFRNEDYVAGLNAGIDGIIARLDRGRSEGTASRGPRSGLLWIPVLAITALIGGIVSIARGVRKRQLETSLPKDLDRAKSAMGKVETLRSGAGPALDELRREAPREVWQEFDGVLNEAPAELASLYQELHTVCAMPRVEFGEMSRANNALKRWNRRFSALWERLDQVGKCLDGFRYCQGRSPGMLRETGESLARRDSGGWGRQARLVKAAGETYTMAVRAAAANPVNWLLVYDLVTDAQDCLDCADNPGQYQRRGRYWGLSGGYSPAYDMLMMQTVSTDSGGASYSGDAGGSFSGGDAGGSFGGGDCGGGGASSSY